MAESESEIESTMLSEHESKAKLGALGFPVLGTVLARDATSAVAAATDVGYPVALKVASPDVVHKAAAGGVVLGLESGEAVSGAFAQIVESVSRAAPSARVDGVAVQAMAKAGGVEVLVGVQDDPSFGPVLAFGAGGSLVELLDDVSLRLIPLRRQDAERQIDETRIAQLLPLEARRGPLVDLLLAVSDWVSSDTRVSEVDLNPVLVYDDRVLVVDARIFLRADDNRTVAR